MIFKILLLTYKALNGLAANYIGDLLRDTKIPGRTLSMLRSSQNSHEQWTVDEPGANLKTYGKRAYSVAGPELWNRLPLSSCKISICNQMVTSEIRE